MDANVQRGKLSIESLLSGKYLAAHALLMKQRADVGEAEADAASDRLARVAAIKQRIWRRHDPATPRELTSTPMPAC